MMPRKPLEETSPADALVEEKEISPRSQWKIVRPIAYVLLVLALAIAVVALLTKFTKSVAWSAGLVAFVLGYMLLMARWAQKNTDSSER